MTGDIIEKSGILPALELKQDHHNDKLQNKVDNLLARWRDLVRGPNAKAATSTSPVAGSSKNLINSNTR